MMPSFAEMNHAVRGIWRLVHLDARGLDHFDRSVAGFWRSFHVAVLVLPAYAVLIPANLAMHPPTGGWQRIMAVELLIYIFAWLAYPVIAYEICRLMKRTDEYVGFIVVYNWSSILGVALSLAVAAAITGGVPRGLCSLLLYLGYGGLLFYTWFISRLALNIDGMTATIFPILEFGLSETLAELKGYMEQ
jgi:hypothetical protein